MFQLLCAPFKCDDTEDDRMIHKSAFVWNAYNRPILISHNCAIFQLDTTLTKKEKLKIFSHTFYVYIISQLGPCQNRCPQEGAQG